MKPIRVLRADEIECRVGIINEDGLSLLLFKDARVDQKILDETFGPLCWKRSHQQIGGNLYCTVEVWDSEKEQWVAKQDVGTASYAEAEKGQASDSFKRACFNWGIGRELYEAPFIWIPANRVKIEPRTQGKGEKYFTKERFSVVSIGYDENRSIISLEIVNGKHQPVYVLTPAGSEAGAGGNDKVNAEQKNRKFEADGIVRDTEKSDIRTVSRKSGSNEKQGITTSQKAAMERELQRTGVILDKVLERYGIGTLNEMTRDIYNKAMRDLKKSRSAQAAA